MTVIPNGIDTARFHADVEVGKRLRAVWRVPVDGNLVGIVARLTPLKDHATYLRAAGLLKAHDPHARFVIVGGGPPEYEARLRSLSRSLGLADVVVWAGHMNDARDAYRAFTICTLTSTSEGFPNVLGEAMACGTPCVASDAGDSRLVLGDLGIVVPPGVPEALASAWAEMLRRVSVGGVAFPRALRARVCTSFSRDQLGERTGSALRALLASRPARVPMLTDNP
jgi:glycosyltransferase involved in cell wall biosynthesis